MSATFAALVVSALAVRPLPDPPPDVPASFQLDTTVTTRTARRGDPVPMRTARPFVIDGVAVPAGSRAHGVVADAARPGRIRGRGALAIQVVSVTLPDGRPLRVSGTYFAVPPRRARTLPPDPQFPILAGMAAGYGTAAVVSKASNSAETIARAGIIAGVTTGILVGVLERGEELELARGRTIDVMLARSISAR